jgi:CBS domain-containing protein
MARRRPASPAHPPAARPELRERFTRLPVVERSEARTLVGMISLTDLLTARARNLEAEVRRERILPIRVRVPRRAGTETSPVARS